MSNIFLFDGRLTATPELRSTANNTPILRFRLIRNEYAGTDEHGARREREVSVPFTAFGKIAETLARTALKGDQLIIEASISNYNYEHEGQKRYDYNFEVNNFDFGAPGAEKRRILAENVSAAA